jgi:hypothetical protein
MRPARLAQEPDQRPQVGPAEVAELAGVAVAHRCVQLGQERQAAGRDADLDNAAVARLALTFDQAALGQVIEQARDVRGARHQPGRQRQGGQPARVLTAQQPEGVVLLRRQPPAAEQLVLEGAQAVVGAPQVQEGFLLRRVEAAPPPRRPGEVVIPSL